MCWMIFRPFTVPHCTDVNCRHTVFIAIYVGMEPKQQWHVAIPLSGFQGCCVPTQYESLVAS